MDLDLAIKHDFKQNCSCSDLTSELKVSVSWKVYTLSLKINLSMEKKKKNENENENEFLLPEPICCAVKLLRKWDEWRTEQKKREWETQKERDWRMFLCRFVFSFVCYFDVSYCPDVHFYVMTNNVSLQMMKSVFVFRSLFHQSHSSFTKKKDVSISFVITSKAQF